LEIGVVGEGSEERKDEVVEWEEKGGGAYVCGEGSVPYHIIFQNDVRREGLDVRQRSRIGGMGRMVEVVYCPFSKAKARESGWTEEDLGERVNRWIN